MTWRMLDLFSGIGGFSYAAQQVWGDDLEIVSFVEIDPFCQRILKKHWPDVPIVEDIKQLNGGEFENIDLITGGFPCQDISQAKHKAEGIGGERSGLWNEYCRIIGSIRPRYAIIENVSALLIRGHGIVLRDLAQIGYDAEWECIPASAIGATHHRERIWIIAYPQGKRWNKMDKNKSVKCSDVHIKSRKAFWRYIASLHLVMEPDWNNPSSNINRNDDGLSVGVDRLKALGNAIVPQVAMVLMSAIKEIEANR